MATYAVLALLLLGLLACAIAALAVLLPPSRAKAKRVAPLFAFTLSIVGALLCRGGGHWLARALAIRHAQPILAAVETHRARTGEYPDGLAELGVPLETGVVGIPGYSYARVDGEFILAFVIDSGHFNFVPTMYRPSGRYEATGQLRTIYTHGAWGYYVYD